MKELLFSFLTPHHSELKTGDNMDQKEIAKKTGETAKLYFSTVKDEDKPYNLWKHFELHVGQGLRRRE